MNPEPFVLPMIIPPLRLSVMLVLGMLALPAPLLAAPFRFLAWDDAVAARKIGLQNGTTVTELQELHPNKRSGTAEAAGGELPLQLVALDRVAPDGKPATVEIKMPAGVQTPLVLILPDSKQATGFRPFVIEDDATKFAWGTVRFVNATGKELLVRLENAIKPLPAAWNPVDVVPGGEARNTGVQLVAREDTKSILYSAIWEHDPQIRKLVFIVPGADVRTGAVDFKIIPEDRRALAPAATPVVTPPPSE